MFPLYKKSGVKGSEVPCSYCLHPVLIMTDSAIEKRRASGDCAHAVRQAASCG